jgi:hypothetical protein
MKKKQHKEFPNVGTPGHIDHGTTSMMNWPAIKEWLRVLLFIVVVGGMFAALFAGAKSCTADLNTNRKAAMHNKEISPFKVGDLVQARVSNQLGLVIAVWCYKDHCLYDVRFNASGARTNTRMFSTDGMIANYPIVLVTGLRDFELRKAK